MSPDVQQATDVHLLYKTAQCDEVHSDYDGEKKACVIRYNGFNPHSLI